MISTAAGQPALARRLHEPESLLDAIENKSGRYLLQEHFRFDLAGEILRQARYPHLRMVVLFRHPVDATISNHHFRVHVKGLAATNAQRGDDAVRAYILEQAASGALRRRLRHQVIDWLATKECCPVRYEDLVADAKRELSRVLDFLAVAHDSRSVERAVERHDFRRLSGGRERGQVDVTSHYRRGLPGEWSSLLGADELRVVREAIGDYLDLLEYRLD